METSSNPSEGEWVCTLNPGEPINIRGIKYRRRIITGGPIIGEGYRKLDFGEIVKEGDSLWLRGIQKLNPASSVGTKVDVGMVYRRKISKPIEELHKSGIKVRCVKDSIRGEARAITIGKVYEVIDGLDSSSYRIQNDSGYFAYHSKSCFVELEELTEKEKKIQSYLLGLWNDSTTKCPDCGAEYKDYEWRTKCPMCENKKWEPKERELYFFVRPTLIIDHTVYIGTDISDQICIRVGNCYRTSAEAEKAAERLKKAYRG